MSQPNRREFLRSSALVAAASQLPPSTLLAQPVQPVGPKRGWYERAWRRAVIDMHIPDWDPAFLSKFDAAQYVSRLQQSRAQSIVLYAQSHVGLFNYPTKVGRQHEAWKGRDALGDLITRCREAGIAVQAYTSVIFDRWAAVEHPEWRPVDVNNNPLGVGRFGLCCPNSPYREYVRAWVTELCERYEMEGIRFDMTFWPTVCFCRHCQKRWADEAGGGELPRQMDWLDERWVAFQRKREQWLGDFAALCTGTVKKIRPNRTVEHQASSLSGSWTMGGTGALVAQNDFLQGDFYGDALQGSFVRKLLGGLTPNRPFGFETSYALSLDNHTTGKSEALLEAKACAAIADSAAFIFIDAIDPVGTVNPRAHDRMGRIFDRLMPYYAHLERDAERVADVGVYYSLESKFSYHGNPRPAGADASDTHTPAAMDAARHLMAAHLPLDVITKKDLAPAGKLERLKVLVLPNVNVMDDEEAEALRAWVQQGGALYASGITSGVDTRGRRRDDFILADVFGATLKTSDWTPRVHYLAPTEAGQKFFPDHDRTYPPMSRGFFMDVAARPGAEVLATLTLPWPPNERGDFSSIHSNPPWQETDRPVLIATRFGEGRAIYSASLLESVSGLESTFVSLIRSMFSAWRVEATAPAAVEVTTFHQPSRNRYTVSLINFQKELPNVPVEGAEVRLRLADVRVRSVTLLPKDEPVPHRTEDDVTSFVAPRLETLAMFAVNVG